MQANVAPAAVDEGADNVPDLDAPIQDNEEMEYKPAIVSSVGTTQNVVLQHRVQPPPKPRSTLKHKHGNFILHHKLHVSDHIKSLQFYCMNYKYQCF